MFSGLAYACYEGRYGPTRIEHVLQESLLRFVEASLNLVSMGPGFAEYDVLDYTVFTEERARAAAVT